MTLALVIGAVWLFAIVPNLGGMRLQRPFATLEKCLTAKAELLRRYPNAFATCDASAR